ncbi:transglycosylase domain-containing protein [Bacillus tianshenii]|nr:transglycosylase domain-containing protein [Bacillus tianshenii]
MKFLSGVFMNLFLLTSFLLVFLFFYQELNKAQTIDEYLNEELLFDDITLKQNSYMTDTNGEIISEIYGLENRIFLNTEEIPDLVKKAFVAAEDKQFYTHKGFDASAIVRAAVTNAKQSDIAQGGSTITQQLTRNVYLSQEQTYERKITELLYAYQLEKRYTKEEILGLYVNAIYFANGNYGISAASHYYFGQPVEQLSLAQIAFLASIPNNPTYYNPVDYFEHTKQRQEWILKKMYEQNMIPATTFAQAQGEQIKLKVEQKIDRYPNYTTYVMEELKELVAQNEGYMEKLATSDEEKRKTTENHVEYRVQELLEKGVRIETNLEPNIQLHMNKTIQQRLGSLPLEGSAVIIENNTRRIVALSGGKDYKKHEFHRAFQAYRQPGSSIKPLLVYAPYLNATNRSIHSSVNAASFCKDGYCPQNYDNAKYGTTSLNTALTYSYNTAAVRLLDTIGVEKGFSYLTQMDFARIVPADYRLPAAVGGFTYGMTPLEMTNAYTTFAHNGTYKHARAIKQVTDLNGKILYSWNDSEKQLWSKDTNHKMREMLASVVRSGTARTTYVPTEYIGGKTGTTNDFKDFWYIGVTDRYTTGVWVGKDMPENLERYYHSLPHQKLWRDLMMPLHK